MKYDLHNELLGIPLVECPANHYRLLGLDLFEADADKIHAAVLRRVAELRKYALHSDPDRVRRVQDLLNEVSRAGTVLESPDGKRAYDEALRKDMGIVADRQPCPNCGANLATDAAICPFCGLLVQTGQFLGSTVQAEETHAIREAPSVGDSRLAPTEALPGEPPSQDLVAAGTVSRVPRAQEPSAKRIVLPHRAVKVGVALVLGVIVLFMVGLVWRGKPAARGTNVRDVSGNTEMLEGESGAVRAFFPMTAEEARGVQRAAAEALGVPLAREIDLGKGVKLKTVFIPPGEFVMGSEDGQPNERPVQPLRIESPFYMGATEVTQAQWEAVMGNNPSRFSGRGKPVECVFWHDCQNFLARLCAKEGEPEGTYRLPTEAEWEYACRAGSTTKFHFGDEASRLGEYAWYRANSEGQTHPVGEKTPNTWGLYDMHGNVWEWCQSLYKPYPYRADDSREDLSAGSFRVLRGGSWNLAAIDCRSAYRKFLAPTFRYGSYGFRVVMVPWLQTVETQASPKLRIVSEPSGARITLEGQGRGLTPLAVELEEGTYRFRAEKNGFKPQDGRVTFSGERDVELRIDLEKLEDKSDRIRAFFPMTTEEARQVQRAAAEALGVPLAREIDLGKDVKLKMVFIPPGEFMMGSEAHRTSKPVHRVNISRAFYMGETEVTQAQWEAIMGKTLVRSRGRDFPVESASWYACGGFVAGLCANEGVPTGTYRLPTEAEWEYACRAGSKTWFHFGDDASRLVEYAWCRENSGRQPHPVREKSPNAWGLYDMYGNVEEWCQSIYRGYPYRADDNREDLSAGGDRVLRGGSYFGSAAFCCSAFRGHFIPGHGRHDYGFRVAVFASLQE